MFRNKMYFTISFLQLEWGKVLRSNGKDGNRKKGGE